MIVRSAQFPHGPAAHSHSVRWGWIPADDSMEFAGVNFDMGTSLFGCPIDLRSNLVPEFIC